MNCFNFNGFRTDECVKLGIDVNDIVILSYLLTIQGGYGLECLMNEGLTYTWLTYDKIVADNPILYMQPRTASIRMAKLKQLGLVEILVKCKENTKFKKSYFRITDKARDLMFNIISKDNNIIQDDPKPENVVAVVNQENAEIVEQWELDFQRFYKAYPKKQDKQNVIKWFKKNKPTEILMKKILDALEKFKKTEQWTKDKGKFIPMPSTWLNNKRWEDEIISKKSALDEFLEKSSGVEEVF